MKELERYTTRAKAFREERFLTTVRTGDAMTKSIHVSRGNLARRDVQQRGFAVLHRPN